MLKRILDCPPDCTCRGTRANLELKEDVAIPTRDAVEFLLSPSGDVR